MSELQGKRRVIEAKNKLDVLKERLVARLKPAAPSRQPIRPLHFRSTID